MSTLDTLVGLALTALVTAQSLWQVVDPEGLKASLYGRFLSDWWTEPRLRRWGVVSLLLSLLAWMYWLGRWDAWISR